MGAHVGVDVEVLAEFEEAKVEAWGKVVDID